jgi:hypothetical protein
MVTRSLTGELVDPSIPVRGFKFTDSLTAGGGSFDGDMDLGRLSLSARPFDDLGRLLFWPCRDRQPMGCYLWLGTNYDTDSSFQSVKAVRAPDYFLARRVIRKTLTFLGVYQQDIARDLIRYATGWTTLFTSSPIYPDNDPLVRAAALLPWLRLGDGVSGDLRTRQETPGNTDDGYPAASRKIVQQMLVNLAGLQGGFEWAYRYGRDGNGLPFAQWTPGVPTVGVPADTVGKIVLEHPSRVVTKATYGADATDQLTRVETLGQEQNGSRPIGGALNIPAGAPLLEGIYSESSVGDTGVLDGYSAGHLADRSPQDGWALTLDGTYKPNMGDYSLGDHIVFRPKATPFQRMKDTTLRITGWSVSVGSDLSTEIVTPVLETVT